jgi:hypothetical protein
MNLDRFERERGADWRALDAALGTARGHPERLGAAGVLQLGERYRAAATSRWPGGCSPATR